LQKAAGALRAALPFVQRILPLLDGNIGTAVSNIMSPYQMAPPAPPVNLEPIEEDLAELKAQHRDLRNRILEQKSALKRVEDQLETVREAADRNSQEQQEMLDDLKAVRKKINTFALLALALLVVSVALNVILYLHIVHLLP
jgi:septation ring formation regulator EzrA